MNDLFPRLTKLAALLDRLAPDPFARVGYDLLADALVWSDEVAETDPETSAGLRPLLRYRTSLIVGAPDERYRPHWEHAEAMCPSWPGFLPERREPKWRAIFEKRHAESKSGWDDLDASFRSKVRDGQVVSN